MKTIISKIQYRNFEPGEYVEEKVRTLEESIRLIKDFPWEVQRVNNPIGITNPSITFEDADGNFLKVAPYYNKRFAVYFLKDKKFLYVKNGVESDEVNNIIRIFFDEIPFDTSTFSRKTSFFTNSKKQFYLNDFKYEIKGPFYFLDNFFYSNSFFTLIYATACFFIFIFHKETRQDKIGALICFIGFIVAACLAKLYFYASAKGKTLILSKGNDTFQYGDKDNLATFNKQKIASIIIPPAKRGLGFDSHVYKILFQDGSYLVIPDIILPPFKFSGKFPGIKIECARTNYN